ncbi:ubiquitin-protein ligase molybdopterin-converting factor [Mycena haematopus]|nr:ubiquitin-protein ligase molybdopterin-converting factor [Mycena haematopus]
MSGVLHSHRAQLVGTAVAAAATTAALISLYSVLSKRSKRHELDKDVLRSLAQDRPPLPAHPPNEHPPLTSWNENEHDDLVREQLARNYAFFGDDAMAKIRAGRVVVVGCGGVGSWAAVMLVRSGIGHIRLVDFDYVTLSSLNRHATASLADVGTPKVRCVARALKGMARWVEVEECVEVWRAEGGEKLLEGADWVVDAIDNMQTKVDLLHHCHSRGIKVFSSMGAGAKSDPTRIQIADLADTIYDPLARAVRTRLRRSLSSSSTSTEIGIPVVYSTEIPSIALLPLPDSSLPNAHELGVLSDWRVRILPVLGPLPALFGLHIATYVLCELAGKPIERPMAVRGRRKVYERMVRDLQAREARRAGTLNVRFPLSEDDVGLLFDDVHRGRSVVPPHRVPVKPTLVWWDRARPLGPENVVVMDVGEAVRHEGERSELEEESELGVWGEDVHEAVRRRVQEVERWKEWVM